jgi:hypothetical protein
MSAPDVHALRALVPEGRCGHTGVDEHVISSRP